MRDRLKELIEGTFTDWECDVSEEAISEITEHLIENGVIAPPCKVGDTVYMPWEYKGVAGVTILTVTHVIIDNVHSYIRTDLTSDSEGFKAAHNFGRFDFRQFGEKVFTSQKEAEKAFKKLIAERSADESITVT